MKEQNESPSRFIELIMRVGTNMLSSGGEVHRVEETLERMGSAFGADCAHVFVITSSINVTVEMPGGNAVTRIRRIHRTGTDFTMLENMNRLSRKFCKGGMSLDELENSLDEYEKQKYSSLLTYLGASLAAASFTVFFGGEFKDAVLGAFVGLLVCFMQEHMETFCRNKVTFNLIAAFITGSLVCLVTSYKGIEYGKVMINRNSILMGVIMLLVPGVALTNSIRDLMVGDTLSGFMRMIESLCWAGALAIGFLISISLFGGL